MNTSSRYKITPGSKRRTVSINGIEAIGRIIAPIVLASFPYTSAIAQGKYGNSDTDSIECTMNLSLYLEYYNSGDHNSALEYWESVVRICPNSSRNNFAHGRDILHNLIGKEPSRSERKKLMKKLHWLYEKWIERDGRLEEILDMQRQDVEKYKM